MIKFKFNEVKTTQAVSLFLHKNGGKMNYMKLIKLLYLTDREALTHWERPLTGDTYVSMKRGPVLSNVLDMINNGEDPEDNSYWYKYLTAPSNYEIALKGDIPELTTLSKREIALIDELFEKFKDFSPWDMVKLCHEILPELEDVGDSSKRIEIDTILTLEDKTKDDIERIEEEISNLNYVREILSINA